MHTEIHRRFQGSKDAGVAESVLRACVHCGFCNATCPTYLDLGDERDGPRGRIYLMKQLLETGNASERTRTHLDRCLTCRNCETTCPSGVQYGQLLDISRGILEQDLRRPWSEKIVRGLIKFFVPWPRRFGAVLKMAQALRFLLPSAVAAKLPQRRGADRQDYKSLAATTGDAPGMRRMIILDGCAQAAATPETNAAAQRVFRRLGIHLQSAPRAGCCGALHYHLGEHNTGRDFMRTNIDAWWPLIEQGAQYIVISASGCGTTVREYAEMLADDEQYAEKAARVSAMTRDIAQVLEAEDLDDLSLRESATRYAVHCPCTLQHGQDFGDNLDKLLMKLGLKLTDTRDRHLCCGSAGSYSLLQPALSRRLRDRKLAALTQDAPDMIVTANVGCQLHLGSGTDVPVRHWIEAIDAACIDAQSSK